MKQNSRIYVAGHRGLVGSALCHALRSQGLGQLLLRTRAELDLTQQSAVNAFFATERPEYVFLAAGRVGGIHANSAYPAEFINDNLLIQSNVIDAAYRHGTKKLLALGSSCIYPKHAEQPIREEALLSGPLEPSNEWYALAKIAGLKMCQAYRRQYGFDAISLMPTNLYGPLDSFHPENAHVLPALLGRFHAAKLAGAASMTVWGSGTPRREFMHADDLAEAAIFLMQRYSAELPINVGVGTDVSIRELAQILARVVGFTGRIEFDASRPDGTPRKLLDVSRLTALGWRARVSLEEGIRSTYTWYLENL